MIVLSKPDVMYARGAYSRKALLPEWRGLTFFPKGRDALMAGIYALGLHPKDKIVVPAYICESVVKTIRSFGCEPIFMDVNLKLQFDVDKLVEIIKDCRPKAVLVIHYFGVPADVLQILSVCRPYGVKVIEDCCHSFMTKVQQMALGLQGHIAIYSMRKSLPIQDGGALRLNENNLNCAFAHNIKRNFSASPLFLAARTFEMIAATVGWPNIYSLTLDRIKFWLRDIYRSSIFFDSRAHIPHPQLPSRQLLYSLSSEEYLNDIFEKTHANYNELVEGVLRLGLRPYMRNLPDGCVPQWFIIDAPSGLLVNFLRANGIGASQWPGSELPLDVIDDPLRYPVSVDFSSRFVLVPIHQSIRSRHVKYILNVLQRWACRHQNSSAQDL